jgi:hypothetical protein
MHETVSSIPFLSIVIGLNILHEEVIVPAYCFDVQLIKGSLTATFSFFMRSIYKSLNQSKSHGSREVPDKNTFGGMGMVFMDNDMRKFEVLWNLLYFSGIINGQIKFFLKNVELDDSEDSHLNTCFWPNTSYNELYN